MLSGLLEFYELVYDVSVFSSMLLVNSGISLFLCSFSVTPIFPVIVVEFLAKWVVRV